MHRFSAHLQNVRSALGAAAQYTAGKIRHVWRSGLETVTSFDSAPNHRQSARTGSPPERPIQTSTEDKLERARFIERLTGALVNSQTKRSTGVAIGLAGPWGSGKSSILNLLREHIRSVYPEALIVNFDPWLVSGRNDLIAEFLGELIGTIKADASRSRRFKTLAASLAKYGAHLSPAGNLFIPGVGSAISGGFSAAENWLSKKKSLNEIRKEVAQHLRDTDEPIIVLIDEIDRVEDDEIRAIAQLVRSVADFAGISYVLAYDPERVIQALGSGVPEEDRRERGRAYLEKIVQLQIPLPITLDEEIKRLLLADLTALQAELQLPPDFEHIDRFTELLNDQVGTTIATPRDIRRLVGTFHVLAGMLRDEVHWLDVLAYSILVIKAPATVAKMHRDPEDYLPDPQSPRAIFRRIRRDAADSLDHFIPEAERTEAIRNLVRFLLPALDGESTDSNLSPNAFSRRRAMLSTLRLGLLPGAFSHEQIVSLFSSSAQDVAATLRAAYEDGKFFNLTARVEELYLELASSDGANFWRGAALFSRKPDCEWLTSYRPVHEAVRSLVNILESAVQRQTALRQRAKAVSLDLKASGDEELIAFWLRGHIFAHGLYNRRHSESRAWFLSAEETQQLALEMGQAWREQQLSRRLIPCRWDLQAVYTMLDTGLWTEECSGVLDTDLADDRAVDGLALLLNGGGYSTDPATVARICNRDAFLTRVEARINAVGAAAPHETALVALRKTGGEHF